MGIHYNYLKPVTVIHTTINEVIININEIIPIYEDIELAQNNINESDIINDEKNDQIIRIIIKRVSEKSQFHMATLIKNLYITYRELFIENHLLFSYQYQYQDNQYKQMVISFNCLV